MLILMMVLWSDRRLQCLILSSHALVGRPPAVLLTLRRRIRMKRKLLLLFKPNNAVNMLSILVDNSEYSANLASLIIKFPSSLWQWFVEWLFHSRGVQQIQQLLVRQAALQGTWKNEIFQLLLSKVTFMNSSSSRFPSLFLQEWNKFHHNKVQTH